MSSNFRLSAVEAEQICKRYDFYPRPGYRIKEILTFGRRCYHQSFYALKDVNFSLPPGQNFGVIGENGAGKSTLLKIISGITVPSSGSIRVDGKVAALLELGMGFHPEFSGRDNAYLNGYIMGFSKEEMNERIDAIVKFSELGEFIERPVKTYSSGMFVRLAFSVAMNVDPEILIIDEVLSVGDEHFQKKSLQKMMEFKEAGKTIIFCSHALYYVKQLCSQAIWLKGGEIAARGESGKVIEDYVNYQRGKDREEKTEKKEKKEKKPIAEITGIAVLDEKKQSVREINEEDDLVVRVKFKSKNPHLSFHLGIGIYRNDLIECFATTTQMDGLSPVKGKEGNVFEIVFEKITLLPGKYIITAVLFDETGLYVYDRKNLGGITINGSHLAGRGLCFLNHRWNF